MRQLKLLFQGSTLSVLGTFCIVMMIHDSKLYTLTTWSGTLFIIFFIIVLLITICGIILLIAAFNND